MPTFHQRLTFGLPLALLMASPALIAQATPPEKSFSRSKEFQKAPKVVAIFGPK